MGPEDSMALPIEDLGKCLLSVGINISESGQAELIRNADADKEGCLTLEGFHAAMTLHFKQVDCKEELKDAFRLYDKDETGKIKAEVFKELFTPWCSEEELADFMTECKPNKEGFIDIEKFTTRMIDGEVEKKAAAPAKKSTKRF